MRWQVFKHNEERHVYKENPGVLSGRPSSKQEGSGRNKAIFCRSPLECYYSCRCVSFSACSFFFSKRALAYYTPAWMTCSLIDEVAADTGTEDLVSTFERADLKLWSQVQREVICAWLDHFKESEPEFGKNRFEMVKKTFE
jgi:hypothetical protein